MPASLASMLGLIPPIPGLALPSGHAHELLFGFALAAVAGDQLGPLPRRRIVFLFAAWLAARVLFLAWPESLAAAIANALFAASLALQLAPRLLYRARRLRNTALPVALVTLCAAAVAMQVARVLGSGEAQHGAVVVAILALSLLMLFIGGRIIGPAIANARGGREAPRVQPRIEGALAVLMLAAIASAAFGQMSLAAVALLATAALSMVRIARWRPWQLRSRRDLVCLTVGYAWLTVGLAAIAAAIALGLRAVIALHVVTIGAMGTLTINVMALTWARLARRDPAATALPSWSTALIAAAAFARIAAGFGLGDAATLLLVSAACWSGAYLLLLVLLLRLRSGSL